MGWTVDERSPRAILLKEARIRSPSFAAPGRAADAYLRSGEGRAKSSLLVQTVCGFRWPSGRRAVSCCGSGGGHGRRLHARAHAARPVGLGASSSRSGVGNRSSGRRGWGSRVVGHYVTTDPPATVLDFYEHAFQASGLTVERSEETLTARGGKGDRAIIVQTSRGYTGKTIVGINALMRTAPPPTNSVRVAKLPDWVPTFPGSAPQAKQEEGPTNEIKRAHFETDAAPADVIAFYRRTLGGAGFWLEHGGAGSENTMLNASSDDYMRFVSVVAAPTREGRTRVQLAFRESSDPRGPEAGGETARLGAGVPGRGDLRGSKLQERELGPRVLRHTRPRAHRA